MVKDAGVKRFLTWNIQGGGGSRVPQIMREVDSLEADVLAFTEVRYANLQTLTAALGASGFTHIETPCPESGSNSVLLAAKVPFDVEEERIAHDRERWASVYIPSLDLRVLCVHIPGAPDHKFDAEGRGLSGPKRKELFWYEVTRYAMAHKTENVVIMGDLNTGINEIDKTPSGQPFKLSENIRILRMDGKYVDTWRYLNPQAREYTWFTKRDGKDLNGFRLDYIWASSSLRELIRGAWHVDRVRGLLADGGLSDHAMVVADLAVTPTDATDGSTRVDDGARGH